MSESEESEYESEESDNEDNRTDDDSDIGFGEVIRRNLFRKTEVIDLTTRFVFNEYYEETIVTEPFDPNSSGPDLFQTQLNEISNFERIPEFLDHEMETMFSSTIIGWMYTSKQRERMILVTTKLRLDEVENYIPPLTDTLFPVCVTGENENPIKSRDHIDLQFQNFNPGMYLLLGYKSRVKRRNVEIFIEPTNEVSVVQSYQALLKRYSLYIENNRNTISLVTTFDRIVDKYDQNYGVLGLYAGGPKPPNDGNTGIPRLCWDQRRDQQTNRAVFRFDVDFEEIKSLSLRRFCIVCSRDALLEVKEKVPKPNEEKSSQFNSLLKEMTFAICDGNIVYAVNTGEYEWEHHYFKDFHHIYPKLVVAPEGFSALVIQIKEIDSTYLSCCYYLENRAKMALYMYWRDFQRDFNMLGEEDNTQTLREIMTIQGLRDFRYFEINGFPVNTRFIFCLAEIPEYRNTDHRYREIIHVYGSLTDHVNREHSANYCYLATVQNVFRVQKINEQRRLSYQMSFSKHRLYPREGFQNRCQQLNQFEMNIAIVLLTHFNEMLEHVSEHIPLMNSFQKWVNWVDLHNQTNIGDERRALILSLNERTIPWYSQTNTGRFREIMIEKEFYDFEIYPIDDPPLNTYLCFTLADVQDHLDASGKYREVIHVYGCLEDNRGQRSNYFYYMGTVLITFQVDVFRQKRLYFDKSVVIKERLFPETGLHERWHLSEFELLMSERLLNYFNESFPYPQIRQHKPLKSLFQRFANVLQLRNQTNIGQQKCDVVRNLRYN